MSLYCTYWRSTIHDIRSAGKSITALLIGIAIDKGLIKNVEQSVYDFFPANKYTKPNTVEHSKIKIKHLLMMSSGLDADSDDLNSKGNAVNWVARDDWINFVLSTPMAFDPGNKWVYTDVCALLLGAIIEEVSGKTLSDFANEYLFAPLGIVEFYWFKSPMNRTGGMGNLYISTLDLAKIGLTVLNNGKWNATQIISPEWIAEIQKTQFDISATNPFADNYGYLWYKSIRTFNGGEPCEYFFASGNGGNVLIIIPKEEMVISITSSAYGSGHFRSHNIFKFIMNAIEKE